MKIFLIIPTLNQGGAERVMSLLANNLNQRGYDVHLVLLANNNDFYDIDKSVRIHRLGFENNGSFKKKISEFTVLLRLRKLLKRERPLTTLSFMEKNNILTILASSFLNINNFISDRRNPKGKLSYTILLLRRLTYRFASGIIAQTKLSENVIRGLKLNKNIKVIPNPIREVRHYNQIKKENIIINVGRLIPEKGQKYLIESFSKLESCQWRLVILGDGILREELNKQITELELGDRVSMPGAVKNVDEWLACSSIFAFPSTSEGFPNALVEAMAAGLPCVSFDCDSGPRDVINDGVNGFLIKEKDVLSLTENLERLCNDVDLRNHIGEQAKIIAEKLNIDAITNEYLDFFKSATINNNTGIN